MDAHSHFNNKSARDLRNDVFPCVSIGVKHTPTPQVKLTDRSWPFIGSCVLHALFVALIAHPAFQYPLVTSRTPPVLWFYPMSPPGTSGEAESLLSGPTVAFAAQPAVAFAAQQEAPENESTQKKQDDADEPVRPDHRHIAAETAADDAEPELTVAAPLPVKKTIGAVKPLKPPPDTPRLPPTTPDPAPPPAPQAERVLVPLAAEPESPRALPAQQAAIDADVKSQSPGSETSPQNDAAQISQQVIERNHEAAEALLREQERRSIQEELRQERAVAEKARLEQLTRDNERHKRKVSEEAMLRKEIKHVADARDVRNEPLTDARKAVTAPPQPVKESPQMPSPLKPAAEPMSVSLPLVTGDIKLVIAGSVMPDTTITFKDFAQSRRDRPFSRAESRRFVKITPLTVTARNNTCEIVIARTVPGVYTFTGVSAHEPANVTVSLKLYEGTSRAITRELGKHTITGRKILMKILMPEGIIWDDNAAFSGNMEDSEGIMKFNTETGLMWKEYTKSGYRAGQ